MKTLRSKQMEDATLLVLHEWKANGLPSRQDMVGKSPALRKYWLCWPQFEVIDGVLCYSWELGPTGVSWKLVVVPTSLRKEVLHWNHDVPSAGHPGILKTLMTVKG